MWFYNIYNIYRNMETNANPLTTEELYQAKMMPNEMVTPGKMTMAELEPQVQYPIVSESSPFRLSELDNLDTMSTAKTPKYVAFKDEVINPSGKDTVYRIYVTADYKISIRKLRKTKKTKAEIKMARNSKPNKTAKLVPPAWKP